MEQKEIKAIIYLARNGSRSRDVMEMLLNLFFECKHNNLIKNPETEYEELLVDCSYDLQDYDDDQALVQKALEWSSNNIYNLAFIIEDISLENLQYVVYDKAKGKMVNIEGNDDYILAICNLLTRALDNLV